MEKETLYTSNKFVRARKHRSHFVRYNPAETLKIEKEIKKLTTLSLSLGFLNSHNPPSKNKWNKKAYKQEFLTSDLQELVFLYDGRLFFGLNVSTDSQSERTP